MQNLYTFEAMLKAQEVVWVQCKYMPTYCYVFISIFYVAFRDHG